MTVEVALYAPIDADDVPRAVRVRLCFWVARSVGRVAARVGLAFTLIAVGGVLAPLLAASI